MRKTATSNAISGAPLSAIPLVGRQYEREVLLRAVKAGTLPHTLIFAGPAGRGKLRLALWLAKAILCRSTGEKPCGQCSDCKHASALTHPDLHVFGPHASIGGGSDDQQIDRVEEARESWLEGIRKNALYPPPPPNASYYIATVRAIERKLVGRPFIDGGKRVVILAHCERMSRAIEAQNALLKTLEEPAPNTHFILTTSALRELLATVRSRAAILHLGPLQDDDIREILVRGLGIEAQDERLQEAVRFASGSVRTALLRLNDEWRAARDEALALLGKILESRSDTYRRYAVLYELGPRNARAERGNTAEVLDHLSDLCYQAAIVAAGKEGNHAVEPELKAIVTECNVGIGIETWAEIMRSIARARASVLQNANIQLAFHEMFLEIERKWRKGESAAPSLVHHPRRQETPGLQP